MKALRQSIRSNKEKQPSISSSIGPKAAVAIQPPKKVIRALYDYEARSSQELSFSRGDFFHVIDREDDHDWYEACNPALPDARGLVPVSFFQALGRTERDSAQSDGGRPTTAAKNPDHDSGYSEHSVSPQAVPAPGQRNSRPGGGKPGAMVYGVVMYDFKAERSDELEAKAGEAIIVIAQSDPEWFVAKPIGRLGGPGLIPVSFVEIRDMGSGKPIENPAEAIRKAGVPRVEEWKQMATSYKNSSITLGKFEGTNGDAAPNQSVEHAMDRLSLQNGGQVSTLLDAPTQTWGNGHVDLETKQHQQHQQAAHQSVNQSVQQPQFVTGDPSELYAPVSARIPRYCFAEEKYWFVIEAMLEDGRYWELSRYYEDFYDFQIALLTEFPAEAGNTGTQKRTLPYMPGPVSYVTDAITEGRLHNLHDYVKDLLNQPTYISRCTLVRQFFAPREGDYEIDAASVEKDLRLSESSQHSSTGSPANGDSRQSSRNQLSTSGYSGASATPRQMSTSQQGATQAPNQQGQTQVAQMKVKMYFNSDLIAIRVPTNIQYDQLCDKIRDRLKLSPSENLQLFYKDEPSGNKAAMTNEHDLDFALQRNEKLLLHVQV